MTVHDRWGPRAFAVRNPETPFAVTVRGRARWALESLMAAGDAGCATIDDPAPRWAAYVHELRALGFEIETLTEPHAGPFAGSHARYVLRSKVEPARVFQTAENSGPRDD